MWRHLWPARAVEGVPITHVTNGVHVRGWLSHDMAGLFDSYLGPRWISHPADHSIWDRVEQIPDGAPGHAAAKALYVGRLPSSAPLFGFQDFHLFRLVPEEARFVAGFAQAYTLGPAELASASVL